MRITGNNSVSATGRIRPAPHDAATNAAPETAESAGCGRALIPLSPVRNGERLQAAARQPAAFLAHLIATAQALPQTRERRRAEPAQVTAIYAAALASALAPAGRTMSAVM